MFVNQVLQLREARLALATKPFKARGSKMIRCKRCLLAKRYCICGDVQAVPAQSQFCLLMYDTEPLKPSNTGRLIADVLPDTRAFLWSRTEVNPDLIALLDDPTYQPMVIFPESHCDPERDIINTPRCDNGKKPLFIILDGTWPEACKMFRKSPYLAKFPVLSLHMHKTSNYRLRESPSAEQFCTAEVAIELLRQSDSLRSAEALQNHFDNFRLHYLASKANKSVEQIVKELN